MTDDTRPTPSLDDGEADVLVNEKPVTLGGLKQTGSSIKKAAIEQGVDIKLDFALSIEHDDGKTELISDNQEILVKDGDHFLATADDGKADVLVNEKPVTLDGPRQTGSSIKKAAIEQGVDIKLDFVLSIERDDGKTELIGDHQEVLVKDGDRFLAIAKDGKTGVLVNEKPVTLDGSRQTGSSIKKAAIEQGVDIQPDFVLSIELGGGKTDLIGDNQEILVKDGDRFLAIANDDNS